MTETLKKAQTEAVGNEAKGISDKDREDLASEASSATTQGMTDRVCRESNLVFFFWVLERTTEMEEISSVDTEYVKDPP